MGLNERNMIEFLGAVEDKLDRLLYIGKGTVEEEDADEDMGRGHSALKKSQNNASRPPSPINLQSGVVKRPVLPTLQLSDSEDEGENERSEDKKSGFRRRDELLGLTGANNKPKIVVKPIKISSLHDKMKDQIKKLLEKKRLGEEQKVQSQRNSRSQQRSRRGTSVGSSSPPSTPLSVSSNQNINSKLLDQSIPEDDTQSELRLPSPIA